MTRKMRDLGDPIQGPDEPAYFEAAPATDRPPLDLDAIRARYTRSGDGLTFTALRDMGLLLDEVTALRAELAAARVAANAARAEEADHDGCPGYSAGFADGLARGW